MSQRDRILERIRKPLARRRSKKLTVFIPSSYLVETKDQKIRTYKVGILGRALAVFRVDRIVVYDDGFREDMDFICEILRYMETPQYLRKILFPIKDTLRYAGVLPPLRTPHHPLEDRSDLLHEGEYREGAIVGRRGKYLLVDIGVEKPLKVRGSGRIGDRISVRVIDPRKMLGEIVSKEDIPYYWGYEVVRGDKLGRELERGDYDFRIGTSRMGDLITDRMEELRERLKRSKSICVVFGGPRWGIDEILSRESLNRGVFDIVLNTIPGQGVSTVRTEEALVATLAILNILMEE